MYDSGKVIIGLVIFVALVTFPFWYGMGKAAPMPKPEIPKELQKKGEKCVEPTKYMRANHMHLLLKWRDWALRDGKRFIKDNSGRKTLVSLQRTCMKCHSNKDKFCDKCHDYAEIKPYCWDCHFVPKESKKWN